MGELVGGDSPLGDLPRDATMIVAGPPMTGKYALMLAILAHYTDDTIVVSTQNSANRVVTDFREVAGERADGKLGVVDCVARPQNLEEPETELIKHAGSPENLTRIGVKFTELFQELFEEGSSRHVGVGLHSLSQLLMHAGLKSVYQFLQVLTGQVRSVDWLFVAVIDTNSEEEEELQTLYHHFDGIVQTRENEDDQRELRVRGLRPSPSDWAPF